MKDFLGGTFNLPNTGITLHRIGYGAMQLAGRHVWGPPRDEKAAIAVLQEAIERGVNHIDTSDFYGPHITNQIIQKALAPYPEGLTIVTKVGYRRGADRSWQVALSEKDLTESVEDNLRNLGRDQLDVVNLRLNKTDPGEVIDKALAVLILLREKGQLRHLGLSNVTPVQYRRARAMTDLVCVQNEYNLTRREDDAFIDELRAEGVAYVPYFPLGGFTRLQSSHLDEVARRLDASPMQVALAWLLRRSANILLIPGTSSVAHLRENLGVAGLTLSPQDLEELDQVVATDNPSH